MSLYLYCNGYTFYNSFINATGAFDKSLIGETLTADVMDFNILLSDTEISGLADVNDVDLYDADSVRLYAMGGGGSINEADFKHGYVVILQNQPSPRTGIIRMLRLDYLERTGFKSYTLHCKSMVGFLAEKQSLGGIYTGVAAKDILADIMGGQYMGTQGSYYFYGLYSNGTRIDTYYVAKDLGDIMLTGWVPIASQRDNLIQVLFATGASLRQAQTGQMYFEFLLAEQARAIPDDEIYIGSTVSGSESVTDCILTEHTFVQDATVDEVVLYDGPLVSATSYLVTFNGPHHSLTASSGLTIESSGANYAIVSGTGTLTGKPYVHVTTDLTQSTGLMTLKKEATAKDMTLVSGLNSANALNRMVNYFANAETVDAGFVMNWHGEGTYAKKDNCGNYISFTHPYTKEAVSAFIKSMDVTLSGIPKAAAKLILNWVPKYLGNNYNSYTLYTSDSTFTPDEDMDVRVVLISGGQGGRGGASGGNSTIDYDRNISVGGDGGEGGEGGSGGRVFVADIHLTAGTSYSISIGVGGAGGAPGEEGNLGTDSRFGAYSSASGSATDAGIINVITGDTYAQKGDKGYDGSAGGSMSPSAPNTGQKGESFTMPSGTVYQGGSGRNGGTLYLKQPVTEITIAEYTYSSAQGGGAAYGATGGNATAYSFNSYTHVLTGQGGGAGANATAPSATTDIAKGGPGGNGGGGGGGQGGGGVYVYPGQSASPTPSVTIGPAGVGGTGSAGGAGGPGAVIMYYS